MLFYWMLCNMHVYIIHTWSQLFMTRGTMIWVRDSSSNKLTVSKSTTVSIAANLTSEISSLLSSTSWGIIKDLVVSCPTPLAINARIDIKWYNLWIFLQTNFADITNFNVIRIFSVGQIWQFLQKINMFFEGMYFQKCQFKHNYY